MWGDVRRGKVAIAVTIYHLIPTHPPFIKIPFAPSPANPNVESQIRTFTRGRTQKVYPPQLLLHQLEVGYLAFFALWYACTRAYLLTL